MTTRNANKINESEQVKQSDSDAVTPGSQSKLEEQMARLERLEAMLNAKAEDLAERESELEAAAADRKRRLEDGPAAPAGDDRQRRKVEVQLLERHFRWLELDAQWEAARRQDPTWDMSRSLEKVLRVAVQYDPYCHGMLAPSGSPGTGKAGEFNAARGDWSR